MNIQPITTPYEDSHINKTPNPPHTKDSSVEIWKKWKQYIDNIEVTEWNNWLKNEKVKKSTLNVGWCLALQSHRLFGEMKEMISLLWDQGADPNSTFRYISPTKNYVQKIEEKDNISIMMYACLNGDIDWIEWLLRYKININYKDSYNKNASFYAILNGDDNVDVITALVRNGIDINCVGKIETSRGNFTMHTPWSLAATYDLINTFRYLLQNNADVNYKVLPSQDTVLHIIVRHANIEMINLVLNVQGVLINEINEHGETPQNIAVGLSNTEIYQLITDKISELNKLLNGAPKVLSEKDENKIKIKNKNKNKNKSGNNVIQSTNSSQVFPWGNNEVTFKSNNGNVNEAKKENIWGHNTKIQKTINEIKTKIGTMQVTMENILSKYKHNSLCWQENNYNNNDISLQIPITFKKYPTSNDTTSSSLPQPVPYTTNNSWSSFIAISTVREPYLIIDMTHNTFHYELKYLKVSKEWHDKTVLIQAISQDWNLAKSENDKLKARVQSWNEAILVQQNQNEIITKLQNEQEQKWKEFEKIYNDWLIKHALLERNEINADGSRITPVPWDTPKAMSMYLNKKFQNFIYDKAYLMNCLANDILDYQRYVHENIAQLQYYNDMLWNHLQTATFESIKDYDVRWYGSYATGLCLPWSDWDVVLISRGHIIGGQLPYDNSNFLLSILYENIKTQPWVKDCKYISTATIPIIKIISTEEYNSMPIDISIQEDKHFGWKCVEWVRNFWNKYEALKPLLLCLKHLLKRANWNDPYKGGMSSYGLIWMIVYFFQWQKKMGNDISINTEKNKGNLGRLFYDFSQYYGLDFNPENTMINAKINEDDFSEPCYTNMKGRSELMIIDPLNPGNNVAKSCYQFYNIKMSFILWSVTLKEDCECACHYSGPGEQYNNWHLEHCFWKRIFNSVKRFQIP